MSNTTSTSTTVPYMQFLAAVRAEIRRLGLPEPSTAPTPSGLPENKGYVFIEWGEHLLVPALIVPKSTLRMGNLHSHVDLSDLPGYIPLRKPNGRVVCHFEPDPTKVSAALRRLIGASKVASRTPVRRPSDSSPVNSGPTPDTRAADSEVASWAATAATAAADSEFSSWADSDEAVDEALRVLNV